MNDVKKLFKPLALRFSVKSSFLRKNTVMEMGPETYLIINVSSSFDHFLCTLT